MDGPPVGGLGDGGLQVTNGGGRVTVIGWRVTDGGCRATVSIPFCQCDGGTPRPLCYPYRRPCSRGGCQNIPEKCGILSDVSGA